MKSHFLAILGVAALGLFSAGRTNFAQQPKPAAVTPIAAPATMTFEAQTALTTKYCAGCHNDKAKAGGMTLTAIDLAHPEKTPELAEAIIRKTRVGLMPKA